MKKILLLILSLFCALHGTDALFLAIKKSDPILVKCEIKKLASMDQKPSIKDKWMYIDFAEEVIIRRRNAIQFPKYSNGSPVYTPAFSNDIIPNISTAQTFAMITSLIGIIISLPVGILIAQETKPPIDELIVLTALASEFTCLSVMIYLLVKRDKELKQYQEQLYENAIEIKHLLMNLETA